MYAPQREASQPGQEQQQTDSLVSEAITTLLTNCWNYIINLVYRYFNWDKSSAHKLQRHPQQKHFDEEQSTCSICLQGLKLPVLSTCSHCFCGGCIATCWEITSNKQNKLKCPVCRREMNLLYRDFDEKKTGEESSSQQLLEVLKSYNAKFASNQRSIIEMMQDVPFLMTQLWRKIQTWRSFWFITKSMMRNRGVFYSILYILLPIDLLPEMFLGPIGLIDDAAALGVLTVLVSNISYALLQSLDQNRRTH